MAPLAAKRDILSRSIVYERTHSMELKTTVDGTKVTIEIEGKLSVATSPDPEAAVQGQSAEITDFDMDLTKLEYISSAGLRVLVSTEKLANQRGGKMRLLHPSEEVVEIFDMTGLADVFEIVA
jgi:anti-sigma B factor antagonist